MKILSGYQYVAEKTEGAYSFDRYANWTACAKKLQQVCGLDDRQTEAVLLSKWMRWAADGSGQRYGNVSARVIVDYVKKQGMAEVIKLTTETFGE